MIARISRWARHVKMGEDSYSNSKYLWHVNIGCDVRISYNVHAQGKGVDFFGRVYFEPITIKNRARIGYGVFIRHGVTIGEGAIIGANSVVLEDVPHDEIWAGNPAKKVGEVE